MEVLLATLIWAGGATFTYDLLRDLGKGRLGAFADGLFWPIGLGRYLARLCVVDDVIRDIEKKVDQAKP